MDLKVVNPIGNKQTATKQMQGGYLSIVASICLIILTLYTINWVFTKLRKRLLVNLIDAAVPSIDISSITCFLGVTRS